MGGESNIVAWVVGVCVKQLERYAVVGALLVGGYDSPFYFRGIASNPNPHNNKTPTTKTPKTT
jgi:hypothetical protein